MVRVRWLCITSIILHRLYCNYLKHGCNAGKWESTLKGMTLFAQCTNFT